MSTEPQRAPTETSKIPWPFFFLFHTALPSAVAVAVTTVGVSVIGNYFPYPRTALLEVLFHPWHPIQLGVVLLLGYFIPGELPRKSTACCAWVIPTLYLGLRMAWWFHDSAEPASVLAEMNAPDPDVWAHFFGPCVDRLRMMAPQAPCLDQFTTTVPFQASLAYSLGAVLDHFDVLRFKPEKPA